LNSSTEVKTIKNGGNKKIVVSVTGLGYVGLPVAIEMAKKFDTIGFDTNVERVNELKSGTDRTNEVDLQDLKDSSIKFTNQFSDIKSANFQRLF